MASDLPTGEIFFLDFLTGKCAVSLAQAALCAGGVNTVKREALVKKYNSDATATYNTAAIQAQVKYEQAYAKGASVIMRAVRKGKMQFPEEAEKAKCICDNEVQAAVAEGTWSAIFTLFNEILPEKAKSLCKIVRILNSSSNRPSKKLKHC